MLEKIGFCSVVIFINLFYTCHTGMYNLNIISVVFVLTYYYYYCDPPYCHIILFYLYCHFV